MPVASDRRKEGEGGSGCSTGSRARVAGGRDRPSGARASRAANIPRISMESRRRRGRWRRSWRVERVEGMEREEREFGRRDEREGYTSCCVRDCRN